jgi:hypothetical protein
MISNRWVFIFSKLNENDEIVFSDIISWLCRTQWRWWWFFPHISWQFQVTLNLILTHCHHQFSFVYFFLFYLKNLLSNLTIQKWDEKKRQKTRGKEEKKFRGLIFISTFIDQFTFISNIFLHWEMCLRSRNNMFLNNVNECRVKFSSLNVHRRRSVVCRCLYTYKYN